MVVDDEPAMREALELALRLDGFDVELASDGRDAIRRLPVVRPDVVLLDVLMPSSTGSRSAAACATRATARPC